MQNKILKNLIPLNHNVKIYVPTTINIDQNFDSSEFTQKTLKFLAEKFDGSTSYEAFGAWVTKESKLVTEKIIICESFCKEKDLNEAMEEVYNYCLNLKTELKQESISLEINNKLYFV